MKQTIGKIVAPRLSVRYYGTSSPRYNMLSWFRSRKADKPAVPVKDTKKLIEDIEADKAEIENTSNTVLKLKLTPENFIGTEIDNGKPKKIDLDLIKAVPFNDWLSDSKVDTEAQLDSILSDSSNSVKITDMDESFSTLIDKFHFTKQLQSKTGIIIPDLKLTSLNTPAQFKNYYLREILSGKLARYRETQPNAIYLDENTYQSPNIHIISDKTEKKKNKTINRVFDQIQTLHAQEINQKLESAKNN